MSIAHSEDYRQGLNSDTVPYGVPVFAPAGFQDEPADALSPYGKRETDRALDRLQADIDAAPDEPEQDWHPSGAEEMAEQDHINRLHDRLEKELPSDMVWAIEPDVSYRRYGDGRRTVVREWKCFIHLGIGDVIYLGCADTPDAAVDKALAKFQACPLSLAARQQAAGEEQERMAETDCAA